jgi:hypothetical protein
VVELRQNHCCSWFCLSYTDSIAGLIPYIFFWHPQFYLSGCHNFFLLMYGKLLAHLFLLHTFLHTNKLKL